MKTVFDEIKEEHDRDMLLKLRAAWAEHKRLRDIATAAEKASQEAAKAWSKLWEQASPEVTYQHAQERQ